MGGRTPIGLAALAFALVGCAKQGQAQGVSDGDRAGYDACTQGRLQSPIDLHAVAKRGATELRFDYRPDTLRIVNNGHTVEVEHRAGSKLHVGERSYSLAQYHVHSPSEHTTEGVRYPLEIHFVHEEDEGEGLAVVGVLVEEGHEEGREEQAVQAVWSHLPAEAGHTEEVAIAVDPLDLLPADREHFFYRGSLTTPPCTESVLWHVLVDPLPMSAEHIAAFRAIYSDNARPVQRPDWCPLAHGGAGS
jgi:carbonic anhydrase